MRRIIKNPEPEWLAHLRKNGKAYGDLDNTNKGELKKILSQEQGYLCCYCEDQLVVEKSHIEHIKPQSKFPNLTLCYQNLLCSCQANLDPGEPAHCGMSKKDWYETSFVSPLDPDCEDRFHYQLTGRIEGNDDAAKRTIDVLKLNSPYLVEARKVAVVCVIRSMCDLNKSKEEVLQHYINTNQDRNKRMLPFITAIINILQSN